MRKFKAGELPTAPVKKMTLKSQPYRFSFAKKSTNRMQDFLNGHKMELF
jgi:hypothetical protein